MSTAIAICHGKFGRASLYQLDRPLTRHAHREGHLTFHVQGNGARINVCEEVCDLTPWHGVAVNPWQMHDFAPGDCRTPQLFLVLYINPDWFLDFSHASAVPLRFGGPRIDIDAPLSRLITQLVALLMQGRHTDLIDGYLFELTERSFELSQSGVVSNESLDSSATAIGDGRVRKSIALMSEYIGSDIDMHSVARESGLSRPHFFKLFRKQTGLTPNLFMNTLRMERAIEYLTETELSVSDIGFDLGFSSQSSFTRFFSSNVGMAPTCYRRVAQVLDS